MKKKILLPAAALVLLAILSGCAPKKNTVTILYTNDIHTYVNNMVTEEDGSEHPGMNYGKIAAMKKDLQAAGETVLLVDAGDHLQGTAYGALDEGRAITDLMNAAGYDLATPGNHEFDYGLFRFFSSMAKAKFPYISCNFYEVSTESPLLQPSYVVQCGDKKVAFVGISSPETMYSTTPRYFQDAAGMPTVSTEGCPLAAYENYLLNYEDAFGSGRITVK